MEKWTNFVASYHSQPQAFRLGHHNAGFPKILLISPAPIKQDVVGDVSQFVGRQELSVALKTGCQELAYKLNAFFFGCS